MTTELEMKEALDGWFYSFDFEAGKVTSKMVPRNHIPKHKPVYDTALEALRVNQNAHDWDDEQDNYIITRREAGITFKAIGKEMGLSESCVLRRYRALCTERGIRPAQWAGRNRKYSPEVEARIVELRQSGKAFTDIAELMKLPRAVVYEIYRTYRVRCDKYRSLERKAA